MNSTIDRSQFAFPSSDILQLVIDCLQAKATKWGAENQACWDHRNSGGTFIKTIGTVTLTLERENFILSIEGGGIGLHESEYRDHPVYQECLHEFSRQRKDAMYSDEIAAVRAALTASTKDD